MSITKIVGLSATALLATAVTIGWFMRGASEAEAETPEPSEKAE